LKVLFHDASVMLQAFFGLIVLILGLIFRLNRQEWLWIGLSITLVIVGEVFNSCIERTVDYISLERNESARKIKDMAAAGVLLLCLFACVCGLAVFLPKILEVFHAT
jgi:diacylglycerol kinase